MKLRDLLEFNSIVIQCHDNPDADTIASGFALYSYLKEAGKNPRLVYAGKNIIHKSNLVLMVDSLHIPIEHVDYIDKPQLLVTVDCQYKEGNVTQLPGDNIAVIDHHIVVGSLPELNEVNPNLGSCSTLMWNMLKEEDYNINANVALSTALYYGLYTDTSEFTEISNPLDMDLRDEAKFDKSIITKFRNANLSLEELSIAGTALIGSDYIDEYKLAIVKAGPCDPNVLGIISDLVLAVDVIDICVVFCVQRHGVKFSVRSCVKEVKASELASEISLGLGSGGGHYYKAGGFIDLTLLNEAYMRHCEETGKSPRLQYNMEDNTKRTSDSAIKEFLENRVVSYLKDTQIYYSNSPEILEIYRSGRDYYTRRKPLGYIEGTDIGPAGTEISVRTVKGDMEVTIGEDTILLIDSSGRVVERLKKERLSWLNIYPQWNFQIDNGGYIPRVKNEQTGENIDILAGIKTCFPKSNNRVKAVLLDEKIRLFAHKESLNHLTGRPGDYLIFPSEKIEDAMIMSKEEFKMSYMEKEALKELPEAVIFDLDGTLLDTLLDLKNSVNYALSQNNMPERTYEEVRKFVGNGIRNLMIRAVPEGEDNPLFEKCFADFKEHYAVHCMDNTAPYQGIIEMMQELKFRNIKMGIVSNKIDSAVKELAEHFFKGYVDAAIGDMEGVAIKPAPDTVFKAAKEMNVDLKNAVYVGDSDVDIATAANAGLPCISVTWGFRDREFLTEHGAKCFIDNPADLMKMI